MMTPNAMPALAPPERPPLDEDESDEPAADEPATPLGDPLTPSLSAVLLDGGLLPVADAPDSPVADAPDPDPVASDAPESARVVESAYIEASPLVLSMANSGPITKFATPPLSWSIREQPMGYSETVISPSILESTYEPTPWSEIC